MAQVLHRTSSLLFYLLGLSFLAAYLLFRNELYAPWPVWWMSVADLPFLLAAFTYGGSSLYLSVKNPEKESKALALSISIPLGTLYVFLVVLNFWELIVA